MTKQSRTVVIYVLLGAGCLLAVTWIVVSTIRDEGRQTRDAMNQITDSVVEKGIGQAMDKASETPRELVDRVSEQSQRMANELGGSARVILGEMRAILRERDEETSSNASQTASSSAPPNDRSVPAPGATSSGPGSLIGEVFRTGRDVARSLDRIGQEALKLDAAEERQLGEDLNQLICSQHHVLNEPRISAQLKTLARPFLSQRKRPDIDYTFVVVDDAEVNAFAHAGGFVYVHRGLLDFVGDEAELQFVLGHEIGHINLGHCVEQVTYAARASQAAGKFGGNLVQIAYQTIALGYSEDKEFEADAWAYAHLGNSQPGALRFLERLAENEGEPKIGRPDKTVLDDAVQEIGNHFRTHPSTTERLMRLRH